MNKLMTIAAAAGLAALTACGGGADDKAARNVEAAAENQADALEAQAANTQNDAAADAMERRAEQIEDAGERRAEQIDSNDGPTTNSTSGATNRVESNVSGM